MADFLLVHGACHGAWCWSDLIPALEKIGHTARAIDMPSHGSDATPVDQVTLDSCRDAVLKAARADSLIVGHCWGGYPISAAAEADPTAMRGLIFLSAYVPVSGLSMIDLNLRSGHRLQRGTIVRTDDDLSYQITPEKVPELFYHDCPLERLLFAQLRLCPQALVPQETPLHLTERYGGIGKSYIQCTDNRILPPEYQQEMVKDWPPDRVHAMHSSHSPFFSDPSGLARLLSRIERQF